MMISIAESTFSFSPMPVIKKPTKHNPNSLQQKYMSTKDDLKLLPLVKAKWS
jgi:hypothetical protein